MKPSRRRFGRWVCGVVLLLFAAVCCAAPVGNAISAYVALNPGAQPEGAIAAGGTAADIPPRMLTAYKKAARQVGRAARTCRGMRWPILAGIAKAESHHAVGRTISAGGDIRPRIYGVLLNGSGAGGNTTVFSDTDNGRWDGTAQGERAVGPFQFLPSTWNDVGKDANGDRQADPHNADDAALGAAIHLCGNGRDLSKRAQLKAAIFQYNHSNAYVAGVLGFIDQYQVAAKDPELKNISARARTVIEAALTQRGVPYSWGGGSTSGKSYGFCCSPGGSSGAHIKGFDCSGLTLYAYSRVGIRLPRTAAAQAGVGRRIAAGLGTSALKPGDLVFFARVPGRDATIHHVGIYLGGGQMVNAPRPATAVRVDAVNTMPGYTGGARLL
ncbi:glycoside hydrolase [Streptomyces cyaneochromogenes]|uniref:Glycoside hydrolase n=1 Tax=Streptomyces cyaneochromogenes TaxID=2496836 RepID=A0A3S9MLA0_9ACTN|nr:bifunctional lytic transglycosylase/C40 family peptidase [Streptomyces cyaneochromogenes]AZQ39972.1 glycoside hydrolase [Streptomyces cyaneochromogenes]